MTTRTRLAGSVVAARRALQDVQPLVLILHQGEDLLELIEHDHELAVRVGKDAVGRPDETERVALEHRPATTVAARLPRPSSADSSSRSGCEPGSRSITNQRSEPGARRDEAPARARLGRPRISPSPKAPRPQGSVSLVHPPGAVGAGAAVSASRPKKSPASASRKARSPL